MNVPELRLQYFRYFSAHTAYCVSSLLAGYLYTVYLTNIVSPLTGLDYTLTIPLHHRRFANPHVATIQCTPCVIRLVQWPHNSFLKAYLTNPCQD